MNARARTALFVHGAGGGGWEWQVWESVFRDRGWHTSAPSLQPAKAGLRRTRLEDYLAQVVSWRHRSADPMVLVGASMGGLLVLAAARGHAPPAMVLVNPVPPAGTPGWPPAGAEFPDVVPWNARQTVAQTLARLPDHASDLALADTASWRDESGAVMSALYDGVVVPAPTTPTLIMSGSADKDVPPDTARHLAGLWGVDAAFFAGVSHLGALLGARAKAMAGVACSWLEAAGS